MRKFCRAILTIVLCLSLAAAASACEKVQEGETNVHLHTFGEWTETPATCLTAGEKVRGCTSCDFVQQEVLPALGHDWKQINLDPSSCDRAGVLKERCERCKQTKTTTLPLAEHVWSAVKTVKEATCEEDGLRCAVCETCGAQKDRETIPSKGHLWEQERVLEETTCTKDGSALERCSRCKETRTVTLYTEGHKWSAVEVYKEATCEGEGLRCAVCERCGERESEQVIPPKGHSFGEWETETEPSCESTGKAKRDCNVCGKEEEKVLSATGHRYDDNFTVDIPAQVGKSGSMSRHCLNKGCNSRTEITPIDPIREETVYTVSLRASSGGELPKNFSAKITVYDEEGEQISEETAQKASFTLPSKNYKVQVSEVPVGYEVQREEYECSPSSPDLEIRIPAHLIMEQPPYDLKYVVGSVMYDMEVDLIALDKADDRKLSLNELFSNYKAVLFNMYFTTCPACVSEMPAFVQAYNTKTESGALYGEEVACVMLDAEPYYSDQDMKERIRNFKHQTNYYLRGYSGATNIPMYVIRDSWLRAYFARAISNGSYPTSILVDCEGVILRTVTGGMSKQGFLSWMQEGIARYNAIRAWREEEGRDKENVLSCDLAPDFVTVKRRRP